MSVERDLEIYIAAAALAVQTELGLDFGDRESGAQDEQLKTAAALLRQATLDCHSGHLDRAELLLAGLTRAAEQGWVMDSGLGRAVRQLTGANS